MGVEEGERMEMGGACIAIEMEIDDKFGPLKTFAWCIC